jgi:F-type H+-transporting ATPase subunit b
MRTSKRLMMLAAVLVLTVTGTRLAAQDHGTAEHTSAGDVERRVEAAGHEGTNAPHAAEPGAAGAHDGEAHAKPPLLPSNAEEAKAAIPTAIWTILIFLILLAILYPTAWKNVLAGLKAREDRIRKDIADAEAARARAEATLKEYNQQLATAEGRVRDMLAAAAADAEKLATQIRMRAQTEAEEAKDRATKDIEIARANAVNDIYAQAAELSTSIASKILRRNLNPDDQRDLVNRSLEQLQTVGKA